MVLILDGSDRVVSVVGAEPPVYVDGKLQPLQVFNYTFNHPPDAYVDAAGALYVVQWWSKPDPIPFNWSVSTRGSTRPEVDFVGIIPSELNSLP